MGRSIMISINTCLKISCLQTCREGTERPLWLCTDMSWRYRASPRLCTFTTCLTERLCTLTTCLLSNISCVCVITYLATRYLVWRHVVKVQRGLSVLSNISCVCVITYLAIRYLVWREERGLSLTYPVCVCSITHTHTSTDILFLNRHFKHIFSSCLKRTERPFSNIPCVRVCDKISCLKRTERPLCTFTTCLKTRYLETCLNCGHVSLLTDMSDMSQGTGRRCLVTLGMCSVWHGDVFGHVCQKTYTCVKSEHVMSAMSEEWACYVRHVTCLKSEPVMSDMCDMSEGTGTCLTYLWRYVLVSLYLQIHLSRHVFASLYLVWHIWRYREAKTCLESEHVMSDMCEGKGHDWHIWRYREAKTCLETCRKSAQAEYTDIRLMTSFRSRRLVRYCSERPCSACVMGTLPLHRARSSWW